MKALKLLRLLVPILLINHCASSIKAQHQPNETKEQYRIKIVVQENGATKVIDTTFSNLTDLMKFKELEGLHKAFGEQRNSKLLTEDIFIENTDSLTGMKMMIKKPLPGEMGDEPFTIKIEGEASEEHNVTIIGDDTTIKHNVIIKRMHTDSLHDVLQLLPDGIDSKILEGELKNLPKGAEVRVVKIIAFINLEEPTKEELKKNSNTEIKKAADEKKLTVNQLNVYPNPSNGKFALDFELAEKGKAQLLVTDLQGKEIYKEEFVNEGVGLQTRQLDLSNHAGGFYLLKIKNGDKSLVKKIVLQHSAE